MGTIKQIDISKIMIGSDIEAFLQDKTTGEYISVIGKVGGTKHDPRPLEKPGCCIQEDNVALEYNVPPVSTKEASEMYSNIQYVLSTVKKLPSIPDNLEITCCSSAVFTPAQLRNPKALIFGCEPDYNAWNSGLPNPKPETTDAGLRSCGGHIHISYPGATEEISMQLVRIFDLFLGVPSVLIDRDTRRRELYGKAGAFRFKKWGEDAGFEYRTLSNWWTAKEEYIKWMFSQIEKAVEFYNKGYAGAEASETEINEAINTSNPDIAQALCVKFQISLPEVEEYA